MWFLGAFSFPFVLGSVGHFLRFPSVFFFSASVSSPLSSILRTFLCFFCLFLRRFGPHASQHGEQHLGFAWPVRSRVVSEWWIRPLNHIKFHFFVLLYLVAVFGLNLSGDWLRPSPRLFSSRYLRYWRPFGRTERQILPAVRQAIPARSLSRPACRRLIHRLRPRVVHRL